MHLHDVREGPFFICANRNFPRRASFCLARLSHPLLSAPLSRLGRWSIEQVLRLREPRCNGRHWTLAARCPIFGGQDAPRFSKSADELFLLLQVSYLPCYLCNASVLAYMVNSSLSADLLLRFRPVLSHNKTQDQVHQGRTSSGVAVSVIKILTYVSHQFPCAPCVSRGIADR